ncbi:MAG TPA: hypothetical protein DDW36_02465 [Candidatus Magasanikbacteria bacterium]|nr:hypothetical protein [Candidatus Magasanikbacteria bacterium]
MKTKIFIILISIFLATGLSVLAKSTLAQESDKLENIKYPIGELDNCTNKTDCRIYCDEPKNAETCFVFAEKNDLMSEKEIAVAKKFLAGEIKGPGGCNNKDTCEEYCNDINHINECISFAEKNDLIPPEELNEAKKVQAAIARGVKPPACGNKKSCDVYCDEPEHMEECITFGIEAGFIQGQEKEDAQKMLQAIKRGVKPPPCRGKKACDEYCNSPDNMETCMTFAMEAGFMSEQEQADAQKMLQAIKKGVKPPACKGREACDVYCGQEEHFEECTNFAEAAGFITAEEAAMTRKTGGKGPGGCKGKEECENFCNNPDNQETCFLFGKENGMIPEEDLQKMEEGKQQLQQALEQAPQEVIGCLQEKFGPDLLEKVKNSVMPSKEIGDQLGNCFQNMNPPPGQAPMQEGQERMQSGQLGPGGCQSPEECNNYCQNNPEECNSVQQGPPPQIGENPTPGPAMFPEERAERMPPLPEENIAPPNINPPDINPPPPSTGPEGGEYIPPAGEQIPQAPPAEQMPPASFDQN